MYDYVHTIADFTYKPKNQIFVFEISVTYFYDRKDTGWMRTVHAITQQLLKKVMLRKRVCNKN